MGKKGNTKVKGTKKLTKKEKKAQNHLKLVQNKKSKGASDVALEENSFNKKKAA
jgi:hypothetical protein